MRGRGEVGRGEGKERKRRGGEVEEGERGERRHACSHEQVQP